MNKTWKHSIFALGVVCGMAVAPDAFAAQGYVTAEQDEAIQRAGREYNRQYDLKHGYLNQAAPRRQVNVPQVVRPPQQQVPIAQRQQRVEGARKTAINVDRDIMPLNRATTAREQRQQARKNNEEGLHRRQNMQARTQSQLTKQQRMVQTARQQQALQTQNARQQQLQQRPVPRKPQQRELVKSEWMKPRVFNDYNDMQMQQAGLMYNMRFDTGIGRR